MIKTFDLHLRASYDRKQDRIVLNADRNEHPELQRGGFHVGLKTGTQSESLLRQQMIQSGVITLSPEGDVLGVQLRDLLAPEDYKLARFVLESGRNIVFTGLTGRGKSTLLDACVNYLNLNTSRAVALFADLPQEHDLNASMRLHLVSISEEDAEDYSFRLTKWANDMQPGSVVAVDDHDVRLGSSSWQTVVALTENKQTLYMTAHTIHTAFFADESRDAGFAAEFRSDFNDHGERVHSIHLL